ncbi:MAG TPA: acetate--CoA ligase family protein [Clostridia bacterium]|nr:acetate--CoA ligase family protein [Clostridia bacterium]
MSEKRMFKEKFEELKPFLEPKSIAIIGASSRTGPGSFNLLEEMKGFGYKGRIFPVNPRGGEILGLKVYTSIREVPEKVDLVIVSVPRNYVLDIVRDCVDIGIESLIIITQGFADADEIGFRLQEEIKEIIRGTKTRIIGPNTLGMANLFDSYHTSFVKMFPVKKDIGVICQSGIFLAASSDTSTGLGIGIDIGNASDIHFSESLAYLYSDDRVRVINMHMEGIRGGTEFLKVASEVTKKKPVLCLKTGQSEIGAKAAASHSGSLAGEDHVFSTAFKQCGVIRVRDLEEAGYLNKTFLSYPAMHGRNVGVITISGGAGIMSVDALSDNGLEVATLSDDTLKMLNDASPDWMHMNNPVDIWPAGMSGNFMPVMEKALDKIMADSQVDACICVLPAYQSPVEDPLDVGPVLRKIAAKYPEKPLAIWIFGQFRAEYEQLLEADGNIVVFPSPNRAARCLAVLHDYMNNIRTREDTEETALDNVDGDLAAGVLKRAKDKGITTLNEETLDLLKAYGIPAIESVNAANKEEALEVAGKIGYPVVIKIRSPQISHKSDVGGVHVNIKDEDELRVAYDQMMAKVAEAVPGAVIEGVLVQPFRTEGVEVIVGGKRDPEFGPVIIFGSGGIYTELFKDVTFRIEPIDHKTAGAMIKETKAYRLLTGFRGAEPCDVETLVDCIVRLGRLMTDCDDIQEIDINPLLVSPGGVVAVDGRAAVL